GAGAGAGTSAHRDAVRRTAPPRSVGTASGHEPGQRRSGKVLRADRDGAASGCRGRVVVRSAVLMKKPEGPPLRRGPFWLLAVTAGFEPAVACTTHAFQACSFG